MARRPRLEAPPGLRYCLDCGRFKPVEDFYWNKTHRSPASMCKPCNRLRTRLRKERYPGQKLDADLRRAGSSLREYEQLKEAQGGVCAICGRAPVAKQRLSVDHCHVTGQVRGLICDPCNTALGLFGDDPERLLAAARYLQAHKEQQLCLTGSQLRIPL
jgi:hypothetical protein